MYIIMLIVMIKLCLTVGLIIDEIISQDKNIWFDAIFSQLDVIKTPLHVWLSRFSTFF